jgi:flagellar M-ring protein FliF
VDPQQLIGRVKALGGSLSAAQLASLGGAFVVAVGVIVGSAYWLSVPSYRPLFLDLDEESAGRVTQKLRDQKVQYRLADGGRTILVPDDQLEQLRLDFATDGQPASGRPGYEIFDKTQFGQTEFLEQVNYRRALEGELARTISTLSQVRSARVHIAMEKQSLFSTRQQPAKASVFLKLRARDRALGAPLGPSAAAAISNLVAFAVEGLRPENVVIMDSSGRFLSKPQEDGDEPLGSAVVARQARYESDMADRVVAMLEPIVGRDRVRVNVAARLNPDTEERIEEKWDPNSVVRSHALTQESSGASSVGGVSGARANVPPVVPPGHTQPATPSVAAAAGPPATVPGPIRSIETTNYEIGKTTIHTSRPRGDVAKLSVAVIVDDDRVAKTGKDGSTTWVNKTRDPAQMQKIHALVASSVGLDTARGDQLTVENIAFDEPGEGPATPPGFFERYSDGVKNGVRIVAVLVLGVLALVLIGQPLLRRGLAAGSTLVDVQAVPPGQLPRTIEQLEGEIEAQLDSAARLADRRRPVLTKRLHGMTQKEPDSAARLVRTWLLEDRRS